MSYICYEDFLLPTSNSRAYDSRKTYKYYFSAPRKTTSVLTLQLSEEPRPSFSGPPPVISTEYRALTMDFGLSFAFLVLILRGNL